MFLRVFQECFKGVSRVFNGCLIGCTRTFNELFLRCFWEVKRVIKESIKYCNPQRTIFWNPESGLSNVVFHVRLSSVKGHLPSRVVFHKKSSSV